MRMNKQKTLRELLNSKNVEFFMEAHSGISARIVEEAGFKAIWASGLTMSALNGMRDMNELSWTQVCEQCEFMANITNIPILLDGDTGYGDFNNFRLLVRKLEQIDVAGVCIEDKLFPKTCSFINSESQNLTNIDEFCGKIQAGKNSLVNKDFVIVARTEAFISGAGLEEALKRAYMYAEAGADAILVHSKKDTACEIEAFMKRWDNRKPVIIVPTIYFKEKVEKFEEMGISSVIWANHNLRCAIHAMQEVSRKICNTRSIAEIDNNIISMNELFRLQNVDEYQIAKQKYTNSGI